MLTVAVGIKIERFHTQSESDMISHVSPPGPTPMSVCYVHTDIQCAMHRQYRRECILLPGRIRYWLACSIAFSDGDRSASRLTPVCGLWWFLSRNTWLTCSFLPFSDGHGRRAVQSCRVQSEGVKNESKGLQETGLPASGRISYQQIRQYSRIFTTVHSSMTLTHS